MRASKRLLDLIVVVPGLLLLSPLLLLIAGLVRVDSPGPVIFRQERIGRGGTRFRIWKFRTMVSDAERRGPLLTVGSDPRITRVGRWLRATKLDELPQLINVLRGDMTLVGPRPEVPRYVALYDGQQRRVLDLVPGVTDPASIAYRRESELLAGVSDPERYYVDEVMPEKIRLNLAYATTATIRTDLLVVLKTVATVAGIGAAGPGRPSTPKRSQAPHGRTHA